MKILRTIHALAVLMLLALAPAAQSGTPAHGSVYVGVAYGQHDIYRLEYDYDGASSLTVGQPVLVATAPGAADYAVLPNRYLLAVGQGAMAMIKLPHGPVTVANPGNNANTVTLDPDGTRAWLGWKDTALSEVPLNPFGAGTTHALSGDDTVATQIAFTPTGGVFYTTGGEFEMGNVGTIDLATFQTTRLFSNIEATGIHYDPFSDSVVFAAFGKAHQVDPANPAVILSSRDDSATGANYLVLAPDGQGHLLGSHWGGTAGDGSAALVLIDYSQTGLLGDASTHMLSVPIPTLGGLSGGLAYDPVIFEDGFDDATTP